MKKPSQVVAGLADGIEVLQELSATAEPVSSLALARKLGMHPVRANRLLSTLAWMGLAHRDKSRRYSPGPAMHVLASQSLAASGLLPLVIPSLEPLLAHPYTVAAGTLWRDRVTFLYHHHPMETPFQGFTQSVYPATASSIGMALLAEKSDEVILALYSDREDLPGPYNTTSELMEAIRTTRANGIAVLQHPTHISMAVSVIHPGYVAVAVSGFQSDEVSFFSDLLNAASRQIAEKFTSVDLEEEAFTEVIAPGAQI